MRHCDAGDGGAPTSEEGKKRRDLGREKFIERVWEWKRQYGGAILDQMKRLGALGRLGPRILHHGRQPVACGERNVRAAL